MGYKIVGVDGDSLFPPRVEQRLSNQFATHNTVNQEISVVNSSVNELSANVGEFKEKAENSLITLAGNGTLGNSPVPEWGSAVNVLDKSAMNSATGKTTIYWPYIVDCEGLNTPGRFMMFWSTDHDATSGGIGMAYSDNVEGPYTYHQGMVYTDTTSGSQTETPTVINDGSRLIMYYQQKDVGIGSQSTLYADSPNGVNWTRRGIAMQKPHASIIGDGHTGYASVYKIGYRRWVATTLFGGGDYPRWAHWYSTDGENWMLDRQLSVNMVDITGRNDLRVTMSPSFMYWRNKLLGYFKMETVGSGTSQPTERYYFVATFEDDFKTWSGEVSPVDFMPSSVVTVDGETYGIRLTNEGVAMRKVIK